MRVLRISFMKTRSLFAAVFCLGSFPAFAADVVLTVEEPAGVRRAGWPVTSGVPFAAGTLREANAVSLRDGDGKSVPLQTDVLARWPDGSVRWLLVDFQADLAARQKKTFALRAGPAAAAPTATPGLLRVASSAGVTTIETGPLRLELNRAAFDPLGAVWLDRDGDGKFAAAERVTRSGGLFVRDAKGRRFEAAGAPAEIVIEEAGPLRVCVRVTGRHAAAEGAMSASCTSLHAGRSQR